MILNKFSSCIFVFVLIGAGEQLKSQQSAEVPQPAGTQQPTFRTQANIVLAPALVKDKAGKVIFGLQAKDFIIEDDGVEQPVRMDEAEEPEPVSLVVAVQTGRTAAAELKRMRGLSSMLDPIVSQPQVQTAIVTFDSEVNLLQDFTFDSELTTSNLKNLQDGDLRGAVILDAVHYSVKILGKQPKDSRRVLLLISETRDHGSHAVNIDDVVAAIGDSNAVAYTLAFSPTISNVLDDMRGKLEPQGTSLDLGNAAVKLLVLSVQAMRKNAPKTISAITGGEYELFKSRKGFESLMTEFTNHLHSRYLLSFEPKSPHPGLHRVSVRLRQSGGSTVLARSSYWATAPENGLQ